MVNHLEGAGRKGEHMHGAHKKKQQTKKKKKKTTGSKYSLRKEGKRVSASENAA